MRSALDASAFACAFATGARSFGAAADFQSAWIRVSCTPSFLTVSPFSRSYVPMRKVSIPRVFFLSTSRWTVHGSVDENGPRMRPSVQHPFQSNSKRALPLYVCATESEPVSVHVYESLPSAVGSSMKITGSSRGTPSRSRTCWTFSKRTSSTISPPVPSCARSITRTMYVSPASSCTRYEIAASRGTRPPLYDVSCGKLYA